MMNLKFSYIIIDDHELDRFLTRKFIEITYKNATIDAYQNGQYVLDLIRETAGGNALGQTIIFLDLQMPFMNGFQFVEEFEKFPPEVQKNYKIVVQTISTLKNYPKDVSRILTYGTVKKIIEKPLTRAKLESLITELRSELLNQ